MKRIFTSISFVLLFLILSFQTFAQISGIVYRDYNGNGTKDTYEPGAAGIMVKAYNSLEIQVGTTATSSSTGSWSIVTGTSSTVRVEFILPTTNPDPTGAIAGVDYSSYSGTNYGSSIQFKPGNAAGVNFGISDPNDYWNSNLPPRYVVPQHINGASVTSTSSSDLAIGSTLYASTGLNSAYTTYFGAPGSGPVPRTDATIAQVGTIWGEAYNKTQKHFYFSSFLKRHCGLADGPGYIYNYDYSGTSPSFTGKFNLEGVTPGNGGSTIDFGSVNRSGSADFTLPAVKSSPNRDIDAFGKVAAMSYGDIDMQPGTNYLWAVNLFQKALIRIDVSSNPTSVPSDVNQYILSTLPGYPTSSTGILRPFALAFNAGNAYLGVIDDASSGSDANLIAYVLKFDPNNISAGFTTVLSFNPNIKRSGFAAQFAFHKWVNTWSVGPIVKIGGDYYYPQPVLSDINFDENGNMILGLMDRFGHQISYGNYIPVSGSTSITYSFVSGDLLKACNTGTGWSIEGAGSCNTGSEFFQDISGDGTTIESSQGSSALLKGKNEILVASVDPHPQGSTGSTYFTTQGVNTYNVSNGTISNWYSFNQNHDATLFGKANGIGDVELISDPAPIEIGNRLWLDINGDGIQNAQEIGLGGVTLKLYADFDNDGSPDGSELATTISSTTGNIGTYYFNESNVADGDPLTVGNQPGLAFGKIYLIQIASDDWNGGVGINILNGYSITLANVGGNGQPDERDNDGELISGIPQISVTIGEAGQNNHSLDFGFSSINCVPPDAGSDIIVCGGECTLLTGTNPSTGTWSADPSNGADATLGASSLGVATVCFTSSASGIYSFIYTNTSGCSDTMNVVVNPKPNAGNDMMACGATCANLVGTAPTTGTWSEESGNPAGATLGTTTAGTANVCFSSTANGTYYFIYTVAGGCTDTMSVVVYPKPNAGADMVACGGTCVTVAGTGPTTGTWSAQSGNPFGATLGTTSGGIATICFDNVSSGTFNFIYNTASGCEDTMSVTVDPKPNAGSNMTACGLSCVNLVGTSPINGTWSAESGNPSGATLGTSTGGIAEVCFTATASGTYNFIYTTAGGCSDTMNVVVSPKPEAGNDMTACGATCANLVGNAPANGTWSAQSGNPTGATLGSTTSGTAQVCFTATASGTYNFIYTTAGGCSDTMNVVVNPKPNAGNDMMACGATCANLVGTAPTTGTWSAQAGNPVGATLGTTTSGTAEVCFTAIASGTYHFIYTTGGGCSDTMSVEVSPKPEAGNDMTACGATCTNLVGNAPANGTWTAMAGNPSGATLGTTTAGTAEVCFTAPSNGTYTFMYTTAGGCSDTMSVEVTAKPIAGPDQTTCYMNGAAVITLAGSGVGTWSEQAGNPGTSTITSTSNPTTTVTNFSTPGTYNYIWMNNTCTDTVSVIITPNGNVGNYVWNDHNNNGLNDEPSTDGINGITVELWKETTPGSGTYTLNQTSTTADDGSANPGYYNFMICETSSYKVKFPTSTNSLVLTTQDPTAATDGNSDATIASGNSPAFTIDVNGSGTDKNNPTIDAGYHLATPTLKSYPNNKYCFGQNIVLKAEGVVGATFNWTTPAGFTGTIDNSVPGASTITILNLSSADNGVYSVTQSFGTNTSAAANNTIDGGSKPTINFLTTACVAGMGEITVNASPSTGLEFAVNDGPYQSSNILTTPGGSVFVVSVKTAGTSCEMFYAGEVANCNTTGSCTAPATDSVVAPTLACVGTAINVASFFTNAASGNWTSTGTGTFSATSATLSPSFVTYTPSAADFTKGHVIVTFTTSDPDGAGPCAPAICSKNIMLVCGLVAPTASNNGPVCANTPISLEANGAVGTIGWTGPGGYTSTGDSVTIANPTTANSGLYTATATGFGCTSSPSASYASTTATILSAPNLTVTAVGNAELCQGAGNGSIDVTIAGGSGNYTTCYNSTLSNCSTTTPSHFSYVAPGNYTVTVVDANCPNNTMSYPVVVNGGVSVPSPVLASNINLCEGDALILSGTVVGPGITINWTKGPGFNAIGNPVTILNATPSMSGEYYAKALNLDGCASAQVSTIVTVAAKPIITHVQVNCIGTSAEMTISATVSGTATLTYSLDGLNYQASNQYSGVAPGNYTLHVKESLSNCETTLPISVINCACPTAPVVNVTAPIHSCALSAIPVTGTFTNVSNATWSATGTGNFTTTSGASPLTTNYTPSAADLALGHVYLILTTDDPDGTGPCTPVSQSVYVILLDSLQTPVITTLLPSYCAGDTVVMVANNVNSYVHWTGVGGYVSDSTSAVLNNATQFLSGYYTATVSGNGCVTKSSSYLLTVAAPPTLTVTPSSTPEGCEGQGNGAIQAAVTGGSGTYNICYVLNSNCYSGASPADFKWLSPGTYTIYVADATCKNSYTTATATVAPGTHVTPPTGASYNAPVCEGSDLVLTATGIAGTYLWTEGVNNFTATGNPITRTDAEVGMGGIYKVQRVESGCASSPVYVDVHVSGMPEIISAIPECRTSGEDSGKITVNTIINGGDPIEYSLNGGAFQTSNVFDYLTNGLYQITARTIGTNCEVTMNGVELYCLCNCGKDALINVFPNPSTGTFTIKGSLEVASSDVSIAVYNFLGQTIYSKSLEGETTIFNEPIDIRAYAAGSYMVKIVIDGQSYIRPITITDKQ